MDEYYFCLFIHMNKKTELDRSTLFLVAMPYTQAI